MKFSTARIGNLQEVLRGYLQTGIPLVGKLNNQLYAACGSSADDFGLFYWASLIGKYFNCSAVDAGYYFLTGLIAIATCAATIAYLYYVPSIKKFLVLPAMAGLVAAVWYVGDVHVLYFVTVAFIPWCIVLFENQSFKSSLVYYFFCGLFAALFHFIRSFAGLPLVCFLVIALFTTRYFAWHKKLLLLLSLSGGYGFGQLHTWSVLHQRDNYLAQHGVAKPAAQHLLWHSVYLGCGFITNDYGLFYGDHLAEKFKKRDPKLKYPSPAYEQAVKQELFLLIKQHPFYVACVFAAKGGVLLLYFLVFAGWAFVPTIFKRRQWQWELPWFFALAASAIPGLVAIPITMYLIGFISCSVFYALYLLK